MPRIMQIYETVLILKPVLADPEVVEFVEKTKLTITGEAGELVNHEIWGRRKLTHTSARRAKASMCT